MLLLALLQTLPQAPPADFLKRAHTYSIVAYDSVTGDLGIAVQSKFPNVGGLVPWARAGIGAVATQSLSNTDYGEKGLELLARGATAPEAMRIIMRSDPRPSQRQVGMVDAHGNSASWTGDSTFDWAGGRTGGGGDGGGGGGGGGEGGGGGGGGGPERWERADDHGARLRRASEHHGVRCDCSKHGGELRAQSRIARRSADCRAGGGPGGRRGQARDAVGGVARRAGECRLPRQQRPLHRHPCLRCARSDQGAAAAVRAAQALFLHHRLRRPHADHAGAAEGAGSSSY